MKHQHAHHDVMSGVRDGTLDCRGKRGKGEEGRRRRGQKEKRAEGGHSPFSLAGHRGLGCRGRLAIIGQARPGWSESEARWLQRLETGHGKIRGLGGLWGSSSSSVPWHSRVGRLGQVPPTGIPGIPASSRAHDSGHRRSVPSKSSTAADQLATRQESKVSVQRFPHAVGHHHRSRSGGERGAWFFFGRTTCCVDRLHTLD
jgi:hypothetical protein